MLQIFGPVLAQVLLEANTTTGLGMQEIYLGEGILVEGKGE